MNRNLRTVISAVIILVTFGIWIWKQYNGATVNPLLEGIVLIIILASGRALYGGKTWSKASEVVQNLKDTATEIRKASEQINTEDE